MKSSKNRGGRLLPIEPEPFERDTGIIALGAGYTKTESGYYS